MVVTNVSQLPAGAIDGTVAVVRVGTWPDTEDVIIRWNVAVGHWVSQSVELLATCDLNWIATGILAPSSFYSYFDGGVTQGWTSLRTLRHAGGFIGAGLKLQDRATLRSGFQGTNELTIGAYWYQFDTGDAVVFSNDIVAQNFKPSPEGIGRGTVLTTTGDLSATIHYFATDWTAVSFFQVNSDGTISATPVTPSKGALYPTLYAQNAAGIDSPAQAADYTYETRWVF